MKKRTIALLILIAILICGTAFWIAAKPEPAKLSIEAVSGVKPQIDPPRRERIPMVNIATPVGWAPGQTPKAPAGYTVRAFATALDHPRWIYRLPNGDILVAETNAPPREGGGISGMFQRYFMKKAGAGTPSANRITLLRDSDGDGTAEVKSVFLKGLNAPFGMALVGSTLYVANTDALLAFPYVAGETQITAKGAKIVDLPHGGDHWTRDVVASPDGKKLFVSVGSSTNIADNGMEAERDRAAVLEVDPATRKYRVFATGLRNPVGLAWEPSSKCLWAVVNERDMLGGDLVPDYLTCVEIGADYGWPYSYWGGYEDSRVQPQRPELLEYVRRPDYALGPHVAALGLSFADGAKLGPAYANGAFIGEHGSWNRDPPSGYKVVFVPFGPNGKPLPDAKPQDFLTGFMADGKAFGRPVGVTRDGTGALLVADDVGNVIWRVSLDSAAAPAPKPAR